MSLLTTRLRDTRETKGLSQRELARLCGLGENQIHRYEAGKSDPSSTHLLLIAHQLGVSTDYLLGLSHDPHGQMLQSDLANDELEVVEIYRRTGWPGVIKLGAERLAK